MARPLATLLRPWTQQSTWWALCHNVLGLILGPIEFAFLVAAFATTTALLVTFPLAIPFAYALFALGRGFGHLERSRIHALLDVCVGDPVAALPDGSWWARLKARATSAARWREIGHGLLLLPMGVVAGCSTLVAWCGSAALIPLPLYVSHLPGGKARFGLFDVTQGWGAGAVAAGAAVGFLVVAPWTTRAMGAMHAAAGRALLGRGGAAELAAELDRAESGRLAAVDTAESERRRIERDLHDGAQQRLVALAMDLGAAKERLATDPEGGARLVAQAHDEAKAALKEIRDLVRGIHPVILEDRGLDAALSAVVARCPVPVALRVELADDDRRGRPPAAVESAAYFVVSEALTNVARHSGAARAWVSIARTAADRLVVEVRDDGHGGASADAGGTGLQGLRDRIAGLGGTLDVLSPPGGPTTILAELPCGS
jgi:signal transduction histidine kinase